MLNIEIDGKKIAVKQGSMLIEAADAAGIYIPRFCYHKKLPVAANCRMCLVDVEKFAKPAPACATPVSEGMRVSTNSEKTLDAQRGVMEFLLINHPLDCPICDQGGECDLQDLAVGYGKDASRYREDKRVIKDKDLGPLIATDMTRCIQCTRCVRFGTKIAGVMELGATGRGEHLEIGTYVEQTVDSELSGNMIDLCPVGALTSKPFRYTARNWELTNVPSVSPHDCVGSNLTVQTLLSKVKRVLPRENEDINEVWLSDRDRFSYEALNSPQRLRTPLIRVDGHWQETDWTTALQFTVAGLQKVLQAHGAQQIGALAAPGSTVEEVYLLQKLVRALGSDNIDHRLRQRDFSADARMPLFPWLGRSIPELEGLDAVLLVGSHVRKDQPLISHRLRKAFRNGAKLMAVNPMDYEFIFPLSNKVIATPNGMLESLIKIIKALAQKTGQMPPEIAAWTGIEPGPQEQAIAQVLRESKNAAVLLGNFAASHIHYADLYAAAQLIAQLSGATLGHLSEANSAGAWLAGGVPHRGPADAARSQAGGNAYSMLETPLKGYILLGVEPELDCWDGRLARLALDAAEFVVMLSPFNTAASDYADVQLPLAPFTETDGTFVNCEGRWQSFRAAVKPLGETRPGWKILRVLGNLLNLPGFEFVSAEEVRNEIKQDKLTPSAKLTALSLSAPERDEVELVRISEVPIYAVDSIVRRAPALLKTRDNPKPAAHLNPAQANKLGFSDGAKVRVQIGNGQALLNLVVDKRVPDGCVWIPAGFSEVAGLSMVGPVELTKA